MCNYRPSLFPLKTKSLLRSGWKATRLLVVPLFVLTAPLHGAVIVSDDFNTSGSLNGTAPDVGPGSVTWSANSLFSSNGVTLGYSGGTISRMATIDLGANYFVNNKNIYRLSMDVVLNTSTTTNWWAIGFSETTDPSGEGFNNANAGKPWMLLRNNGQTQVFSGPGTTGPLLSSPPSFATNTTHTIQLVLNTNPTLWTLDAYVDSFQLDLNGAGSGNTFTFSSNPVLRYVGITSNLPSGASGVARVDNFTLQTVPEPNALSCVLLGAAILIGFNCRRSASRGFVRKL